MLPYQLRNRYGRWYDPVTGHRLRNEDDDYFVYQCNPIDKVWIIPRPALVEDMVPDDNMVPREFELAEEAFKEYLEDHFNPRCPWGLVPWFIRACMCDRTRSFYDVLEIFKFALGNGCSIEVCLKYWTGFLKDSGEYSLGYSSRVAGFFELHQKYKDREHNPTKSNYWTYSIAKSKMVPLMQGSDKDRFRPADDDVVVCGPKPGKPGYEQHAAENAYRPEMDVEEGPINVGATAAQAEAAAEAEAAAHVEEKEADIDLTREDDDDDDDVVMEDIFSGVEETKEENPFRTKLTQPPVVVPLKVNTTHRPIPISEQEWLDENGYDPTVKDPVLQKDYALLDDYLRDLKASMIRVGKRPWGKPEDYNELDVSRMFFPVPKFQPFDMEMFYTQDCRFESNFAEVEFWTIEKTLLRSVPPEVRWRLYNYKMTPALWLGLFATQADTKELVSGSMGTDMYGCLMIILEVAQQGGLLPLTNLVARFRREMNQFAGPLMVVPTVPQSRADTKYTEAKHFFTCWSLLASMTDYIIDKFCAEAVKTELNKALRVARPGSNTLTIAAKEFGNYASDMMMHRLAVDYPEEYCKYTVFDDEDPPEDYDVGRFKDFKGSRKRRIEDTDVHEAGGSTLDGLTWRKNRADIANDPKVINRLFPVKVVKQFDTWKNRFVDKTVRDFDHFYIPVDWFRRQPDRDAGEIVNEAYAMWKRSKMEFANATQKADMLDEREYDAAKPDMRLWSEIIFLQNFTKNTNIKFVIENVKPYYEPFVKPTAKLGRHLFWANFEIPEIEIKDGLTHNERGSSEKGYFDLRPYKMEHRKDQIIRNCVDPNVGEYVLRCALANCM